MDRLLFGDNQFFGVNHMSEEKARAQALRFQEIDAVIDVLDAAYDEGVSGHSCAPHTIASPWSAITCARIPTDTRTSSSTRACRMPTSTRTR